MIKNINLAVIAFTFLFIGCSAKTRPDICETDRDCLEDQLCIDELCTLGNCRQDQDCPAGQECSDFSCLDIVACQSNEDCKSERPICDTSSGRCVVCDPQCGGKCCGDDACSGTCEDNCSLTSQTCDMESCQCEGECIADCESKECGSDGCEGTCAPGCPDGEACSEDGQCVCVPDCSGKACGSNGCGSECGPGCSGTDVCDADGKCSACAKECGTRECGPDPVCGISCGDCNSSDSCNLEGVCGPWCEVGQTRCTEGGFGFEVCGFQTDIEKNTFGWRIPCAVGDACSSQTGVCERSACLNAEVTFLLDRSSSMLSGNTWDWLTSGFLEEIRLRDDANAFGFRQFPSNTACSVGSVMSMNTNNYSPIKAVISTPSSGSATPIEDALKGFAGEYGDPNDGQAVILLTDGDETCGTQQGALQAASALWRSGIRVYVIAVTTTANKTFLDQVALAGGTEASTRVTTEKELRTTLSVIFEDLFACDCKASDMKCDGEIALTCGQDFLWQETLCQFPDSCEFGECVCQAQCSGKECGDDLCGDQCGSCSGQDTCIEDICVCQADCTDKQCGSDGCDSTCGTCPQDLVCFKGTCTDSCGAGIDCFEDDFEDGDDAGWYNAGGSYTRGVMPGGADGSSYSFELKGGSSNHFNGAWVSLNSLTPSYIGFWVKSFSTTTSDGYFVIGGSTMSNGVIWFFMTNEGKIRLSFGSSKPSVGNIPYTADTWYHVEFKNMDWSSRSYDFYLDDTLIQSDVEFRDSAATSLGQLQLYNYDSSQARWDEIQIHQ